MKSNGPLLIAEATALVGALVFGSIWYSDPGGNWEPLFGLSSLITVGTEIYRRFAGRSKRFESNAARVQHREALRKSLQDEIYRCRAEKLRQDVIVRHVDRVDSYPTLDEDEPGISSVSAQATTDFPR